MSFASEYQPILINLSDEIFSEENIFKAGTVATASREKTAFRYVKKKYERKHWKELHNSKKNSYLPAKRLYRGRRGPQVNILVVS